MFHRLFALSVLVALLFCAQPARGQAAKIDFRYAPEYWYSALGFPEDYHKPLADDFGALLYDFGPGPYVKPGTRISFAAPEGSVRTQTYEDPRIPVLQTNFSNGPNATANITTYTLPYPDQDPPRHNSPLIRIGGLTGTLAWASPPGNYDPAFRNVAWGTNRPITYQLSVDPGQKKQIALGFCESYRDKPGLRKLTIAVDGADPISFDPLSVAEKNIPFAFVLNAEDSDRDGLISIEVLSPEGDPNTILNVLWVFDESVSIDLEDLLAGRLSQTAEVYHDAGRGPQILARPPRFDVLRLSAPDTDEQVLTIDTKRDVRVEGSVVLSGEKPFAFVRPLPTSWVETATGVDLHFASGDGKVDVVVQDGYGETQEQFPSWHEATDLKAVREKWTRSQVPYNAVSIPDDELQRMINASIRTVYQFTEYVDGQLHAQPGAALYRGLWMHDGVYFADLMAQLGDFERSQQLVERLLTFQHDTGQAEIMRPNSIHRETPLLVWLLCRFSELSEDDKWLRDRWSRVQSGIEWIRHLREQTLVPGAPNYGLTPSGFADGGIHGVQPEYASVNWVLIALPEAVRSARRLGYDSDAAEWQALYELFLASFREAMERDLRTDAHGNAFLPIRVGEAGASDIPQRAQWMLPEALAFGDHILPTDSLAVGTLRMLESSQKQGLITNTGWLNEGIWVYFGGLLAEGYLRVGNGQRAAELLYAMANHASPVYTWPEEQMPVGQGRRTAGDFPHGWASSTIPRLAIRLLAFEDGQNLTLFRGIPQEWLQAGSTTSLHHVATRFGRIDLRVAVSESGDSVEILISPIRQRPDSNVSIDWGQFRLAGFRIPTDAAQPGWNSEFTIRLER